MLQTRNSIIIVVLACLTALSAPLSAETCAPGPNLADTTGDGRFDYACVGDWNDNGSCEMVEDIQAAIDQLDDPGGKFVPIATYPKHHMNEVHVHSMPKS